jgi:hypothetical protein
MSDGDSATLVMGDSNECFEVVLDLGLRPAAVAQQRAVSRKRQLLLRAAIEFIRRQHGAGSSWACYVGPAAAFDEFGARVVERARRERRTTPM